MSNSSIPETAIKELALPLERDVFLRTLIRELAGTLQEVVGLDEAAGLHQRRRPADRRPDQRELRVGPGRRAALAGRRWPRCSST